MVAGPEVHVQVKYTCPPAYAGETTSAVATPSCVSVTDASIRVVVRSRPDCPPVMVLLAVILDAGTVSLIVAVSITRRLPSAAATTATALKR